uniref:Uncharacterized protein n=1 Tax=Plectus sambesii TaxID=2011161 RepID=A0A914V9C5_9BILA
MLSSIFERTPAELLHEIVLLDDFSDTGENHWDTFKKSLKLEEKLRRFGQLAGWPDKLRFFATDKREGLIRAKVLAARYAT